MSLISDAYHRTTQIADSLFNLVTGLGTQKDPRSSSQFIFCELDRTTLEQMYRSDWLARRLVDLPAEDATREWRSWVADAKVLQKIDALERKLELQKKVRMALIRARLYGGGALVLGVDQGQPEEELDFEQVGLNDLKFVVVVNRYELAAGPRIYNVDSPWYTRPEYYTVSTPMFGFFGEQGGAYPANPSAAPTPRIQKQAGAPLLPDVNRQVQPNYGMVQVHPSRVIEFSGNELPDWRLAPMGGGWGDSILQTVQDSLKDFSLIMGGLASMINDMKMDVVRIPELSRKLSTADMTQKTLQRFGLANMAKSSINTLLLDKDEEWTRINTSFGSTPELIRTAMTVACASGGVPESRVMGNAPSHGLQGTGTTGGEQDVKNYYDDIASQQKSKYKPMLWPLDVCIQRSATGKFDTAIDYSWNPLYQPSPQEKAQEALVKAQATQVYVNAGLINEDALREAVVSQLVEDEIYPGLEDAIEEFGSEPEEPPAPQVPIPPTPPPGFVPKGQFDPNPFHMLRAQTAAKAGQPIRVPPNRPAGPPKFAPSPPGALTGAKDEWLDDEWIEDFNPYHDPDTGKFTSGQALAHKTGTSAVAGAVGRTKSAARSESAKAAHAARRARAAEPFKLPANATPREAGVTAVSRVIAAERAKGHAPTKGEMASAARQDIKQAAETFVQTMHLKEPTLPAGVDSEKVRTAARLLVTARQFVQDPETRRLVFGAVSKNSMSLTKSLAAGLPAHALAMAHHTLVEKIGESFADMVTETVMGAVVGGATLAFGPIGAAAGTAASFVLKTEIRHGVDKMADEVGLTPEHITEALGGVGKIVLDHYRKWRDVARAGGHRALQMLEFASDAEPDEPPDPIEEVLQAIAEEL